MGIQFTGADWIRVCIKAGIGLDPRTMIKWMDAAIALDAIKVKAARGQGIRGMVLERGKRFKDFCNGGKG